MLILFSSFLLFWSFYIDTNEWCLKNKVKLQIVVVPLYLKIGRLFVKYDSNNDHVKRQRSTRAGS